MKSHIDNSTWGIAITFLVICPLLAWSNDNELRDGRWRRIAAGRYDLLPELLRAPDARAQIEAERATPTFGFPDQASCLLLILGDGSQLDRVRKSYLGGDESLSGLASIALSYRGDDPDLEVALIEQVGVIPLDESGRPTSLEELEELRRGYKHQLRLRLALTRLSQVARQQVALRYLDHQDQRVRQGALHLLLHYAKWDIPANRRGYDHHLSPAANAVAIARWRAWWTPERQAEFRFEYRSARVPPLRLEEPTIDFALIANFGKGALHELTRFALHAEPNSDQMSTDTGKPFAYPELMPALRAIWWDSRDERQVLERQLAQGKTPFALLVAAGLLAHEDHQEAAAMAFRELADYRAYLDQKYDGKSRKSESLDEAETGARHRPHRDLAILALSRFGRKAPEPLALDALSHDDPEVRLGAMQLLAESIRKLRPSTPFDMKSEFFELGFVFPRTTIASFKQWWGGDRIPSAGRAAAERNAYQIIGVQAPVDKRREEIRQRQGEESQRLKAAIGAAAERHEAYVHDTFGYTVWNNIPGRYPRPAPSLADRRKRMGRSLYKGKWLYLGELAESTGDSKGAIHAHTMFYDVHHEIAAKNAEPTISLKGFAGGRTSNRE
jgi:hypothetical protein